MSNRFLSALAALILIPAVYAQTPKVNVSDAWVRGTVAHQRATGAFMEIQSDARTTLVSASSPVAGVVEIHEMAMENNIMRMRQIPGIEVPAGGRVSLKPGGYHVMLMELKQPLSAGQTVPITLTFEDANRQRFNVEIQAPVRALGGGMAGHGHAGHGGHGGHGHGGHGGHGAGAPGPANRQ